LHGVSGMACAAFAAYLLVDEEPHCQSNQVW